VQPTPFPDLNNVLDELVDGYRTVLAGNFCGAYLQGSFALGDADENSDVDFMIVTHDELTGPQVDAIRDQHPRLCARPSPWAQHLEGSIVAAGMLRRPDPARAACPYFDNGSTTLE
jgi:hypothetical protein